MSLSLSVRCWVSVRLMETENSEYLEKGGGQPVFYDHSMSDTCLTGPILPNGSTIKRCSTHPDSRAPRTSKHLAEHEGNSKH